MKLGRGLRLLDLEIDAAVLVATFFAVVVGDEVDRAVPFHEQAPRLDAVRHQPGFHHLAAPLRDRPGPPLFGVDPDLDRGVGPVGQRIEPQGDPGVGAGIELGALQELDVRKDLRLGLVEADARAALPVDLFSLLRVGALIDPVEHPIAVGVGGLQVVLEKGESEDWFATPYIVGLTIATAVAAVVFIWREISTDHPVVNFRILKNRSFAVGILTSFSLGFALYGSVFIFPVFCQNLLGFTPQQTGLILLPGGVATILMMPFVGVMLKRGVPAQLMATGGFILFFVFTWMLSNSTLSSGTGDFFWPLVIRGIGMSILFVPLTALALQELKGPEIGQGTGLNNMMRQLGGSFGIAILTTLIHIKAGKTRNILIEPMNAYNPAYNQREQGYISTFMQQGHSFEEARNMAHAAFEGIVQKQTLLVTYDNMYLLIGAFVLCSIPVIYLQKFKKKIAMPTDAH